MNLAASICHNKIAISIRCQFSCLHRNLSGLPKPRNLAFLLLPAACFRGRFYHESMAPIEGKGLVVTILTAWNCYTCLVRLASSWAESLKVQMARRPAKICTYSTSLTKESALLIVGQDRQLKHLFMIIDKPTPIEAFHHCFHTEHGLLLNDLAILCSHRLIPGCHFCWLLLFWPCKFLQPYLSQASTLILQRLKLFQHPLSYRFTLSFKLDLCTPDFKFQARW